MDTKLVTASELDPVFLDSFLSRVFPSEKSEFLQSSGNWWHKGSDNRWVILVGGQIAGYCAVIPTQLIVDDLIHNAIWWVDIMIAPEFRGKGLQSMFDKKIQELGLLKLGFPNEVAAKIHLKHGWGVREDFYVRLFPLRPLLISQVKNAMGQRGSLLRLAAFLLTPIMLVFRIFLKLRRNKNIEISKTPNVELFVNISNEVRSQGFSTTVRDEGYFSHRFVSSPFREDYNYFVRYQKGHPTHYLITRDVIRNDVVVTRILDFFGDFKDKKGLRDIISAALSDASKKKASQITVLCTLPSLNSLFLKMGFIAKTLVRFCWHSSSVELMDRLHGPVHFSLSDSDNDDIG